MPKDEPWCPAEFYIEGMPHRCQLNLGHSGFHCTGCMEDFSPDGVNIVSDGAQILMVFQERKPDASDEAIKVPCKLCSKQVDFKTAHLHQGAYVGDECCWDERLRATE